MYHFSLFCFALSSCLYQSHVNQCFFFPVWKKNKFSRKTCLLRINNWPIVITLLWSLMNVFKIKYPMTQQLLRLPISAFSFTEFIEKMTSAKTGEPQILKFYRSRTSMKYLFRIDEWSRASIRTNYFFCLWFTLRWFFGEGHVRDNKTFTSYSTFSLIRHFEMN